MKTHNNGTFTPGPWTFHASDGGDIQIRAADADPTATVDMDYSKPSEAEANARLIAAAPELLAALEDTQRILDRLVSRFSEDDDLVGQFHRNSAAIAKALGS